MVFEQFLDSERVKKHVLSVLGIGIVYVLVGYVVSIYFFEESVSVAMLFTTTLLLVPSAFALLGIEEKIERRQGVKRFYHNHKDILKVYLSLFVGIFLAFIVLGNIVGPAVFRYQIDFLKARGDLAAGVLDNASTYVPSFQSAWGLITQNILAMVICFALSIFYGAGALFLITFNASVFAAFITQLMRTVSNPAAVLGFFLIHSIPEIAGFLVAAIAGGVVSRALMKERIGSPKFKNVMRDALLLLCIAAVLIIIAGLLEAFVTAPLATSYL